MNCSLTTVRELHVVRRKIPCRLPVPSQRARKALWLGGGAHNERHITRNQRRLSAVWRRLIGSETDEASPISPCLTSLTTPTTSRRSRRQSRCSTVCRLDPDWAGCARNSLMITTPGASASIAISKRTSLQQQDAQDFEVVRSDSCCWPQSLPFGGVRLRLLSCRGCCAAIAEWQRVHDADGLHLRTRAIRASDSW